MSRSDKIEKIKELGLKVVRSVEEFDKLYPNIIRAVILYEKLFENPDAPYPFSDTPKLPYPFHVWVERWADFFRESWKVGQRPPGPGEEFNFHIHGLVIAVEELASHILQENAIRFSLFVKIESPDILWGSPRRFIAYWWEFEHVVEPKLRIAGLTLDKIFKWVRDPYEIFTGRETVYMEGGMKREIEYKGNLYFGVRVKISADETSYHPFFHLSSGIY